MAKKVQPTSKAAYNSITLKEKQAMWSKIIAALRKKRSGATAYEVSQIIGVDHVRVARRMNELVTAGQVFNTPVRRPTNTGRMAIVRMLKKSA